jgi:hypothetical protein
MIQAPLRLRGKLITPDVFHIIHHTTKEHYLKGRTFLSVKVCERLGWFQPNGQVQDVACREILRRLESLGLISLPAARRPTNNQAKRRGPDSKSINLWPRQTLFQPEGTLKDWGPALLQLVENRNQSLQWRDWVAHYHYLGYAPMVGRSLKYFIYLRGVLAGAISWGSPSWKLACRDAFIGWDWPTREKNLKFLAGNHRFLILPWVRIKNLASHVLSLCAKQVAQDWYRFYSVPLYLLESFVDPSRFKGTSYKAANWSYLGHSKGASKSGNSYRWHGQIKDIYILPLVKDFRQKLCQR